MIKNQLKAVELFAGIGGFRLGMENANIETIWANDLSELCCKVYESNFGKGSIVLGNINQINISDIPEHDLLTAGFPCQPFSAAGKKLGVKDQVRGTIFEQIVKILAEKQPKYFLLENVKRILTMQDGSHFRIILNALSSLDYFIEWRIITPLNFGIPQNRERIFIFGSKLDKKASRDIELERKSIFLTNTDISSLPFSQKEMTKFMQPIMCSKTKNYNWGMAYKNTMYTRSISPLPNYQPRIQLKDILQEEVEKQFDFTDDTIKRIKESKVVNRYCNDVEILYNQDGGARLGYTVFGINGIASTLTASTSRHYERYKVGDKFRRLTNVEYARLMGFPDDWCREARIYDQYALFGNAVVPVCVEWICKRIGKSNLEWSQQRWQQLTLAIASHQRFVNASSLTSLKKSGI